MSAAPVTESAVPLRPHDVPALAAMLSEAQPGEDPREPILANQALLDALDRGHVGRFMVWPPSRPRSVVLLGTGGRVVPAGHASAGPALAHAVGAGTWRVVIGPQQLVDGMLEAWTVTGRGRVWRRRANVREQRHMRVVPEDVADLAPPDGMRMARRGDLDDVTELAARLHVEDLGRPPLSRAGRGSVRSRMQESIDRGDTFVIEHAGRVVAKADVSLFSPSRGAQIAGVYVEPAQRGRGLAGRLVVSVARTLVLEGLPGVTLHVRAGNLPAIRAYRRAGFVDRGPLTLALR